METIECTHCLTKIPAQASVCTGCQAEVSRGVPKWAFDRVAFWSPIFAIALGIYLHSFIVGVVVYFIVAVSWFKINRNKFKDRVEFIRVYRTNALD